MVDVFLGGPLALSLNAASGALRDKFVETLALYDVKWKSPHHPIKIEVVPGDAPAAMVGGTFLECARMKVDAAPPGLRAICPSGVAARYDEARGEWLVSVPPRFDAGARPEDIEDLISLILTTGWRRAGWVPMHAGAVVNGARCVFLCAPSGGGKTSLAVALIRRQWQTLGDDKLLLRIGARRLPEIAALMHHANLHPKAREWFPEVGDLERLPPYSAWTPKRRVDIRDIWRGKTVSRGCPTHLLSIARREAGSGVRIAALSRADVLSTLLRQTVIPRERTIAAAVLSTIGATARRLEGLHVEIAEDAYRDPDCLEPLEHALQ